MIPRVAKPAEDSSSVMLAPAQLQRSKSLPHVLAPHTTGGGKPLFWFRPKVQQNEKRKIPKAPRRTVVRSPLRMAVRQITPSNSVDEWSDSLTDDEEDDVLFGLKLVDHDDEGRE